MNFGIHLFGEKLKPHDPVLVHFALFRSMCCLNFPTMMFGCLHDVVCMFDMLNLLMMYEPCV